MSDEDEVDSEFVRVSFSSRCSKSLTIEQSVRRRTVTSADWKPKKQRILLSRVNAATYNCLAKLRKLFSPCFQWNTISKRSQIVFLGETYGEFESTLDLLKDIHSRLYFSYRTGFSPLKHSRVEINSDTGWGCTIRTAQMLIGEGLLRHFVKRSFRRQVQTTTTLSPEHRTVKAIQRLFHDEASSECPLSIHHLTTLAFREFGKKPGQWYNPSMLGHVLYKAVNEHQASDRTAPQLNDVCVYVAQDGCIFVQDLVELCCSGSVKWRAPIILVALRLGIEFIRPAYYECLQRVFENRFSIGVVGGRRNSSYFFLGYQDDELLYLDPHYLQSCEDRDARHYFAREVKRMRFKNLQPSCLLGFYCRNEEELGIFLKSVEDDVWAIESGKTFRLVDICVGSANCLESRMPRKSIGSLEILLLREQRDNASLAGSH